MPIFLDTRGRSTISIGICARCGEKKSREDLFDDPNSPGLKCCREDLDVLDPWRLPARAADDLSLEWARPDTPLAAQDPIPVYANLINGIGTLLPNVAWSATTFYQKGQLATPINPNDPQVNSAANDVPLPIYQFVALNSGISGAAAPNWPVKAGVEIADGAVTWLCLGGWIS